MLKMNKMTLENIANAEEHLYNAGLSKIEAAQLGVNFSHRYTAKHHAEWLNYARHTQNLNTFYKRKYQVYDRFCRMIDYRANKHG